MTTITTRAGKGSPLTNNEMDANLTGLNDDKVEASGDSMTGNLSFGDNNKVILGSGNDLQLYHDGTNSYIVNTTNDLIIGEDTRVRIKTPSLLVNNAADTENLLTATENGAVTLFYDNTARLATTSTGIDVTGSISADGLTVDVTDQVIINHSGDGGGIRIDSTNGTNTGSLRFGDDLDNYIGAVEYNHSTNTLSLYADNATRVAVNSSGIDVTGSVVSDGLIVDGGSTNNDSSAVTGKFNANGNEHIRLEISTDSTIGNQAALDLISNSITSRLFTTGSGGLVTSVNGTNRMAIATNGDISFYNDAGTSQDLFWDASTSRLGLGETNPAGALHIHGGSYGEQFISSSNSAMRFVSTGGVNYIQSGTATSSSSAADLIFTNVGGSGETMRITSAGNVGIGTGSTSVTSGFKMEVLGDVRVGDAVGDDAVELGWSAGGSVGFIQAYDRGASAFRDLKLNNALTVKSSGAIDVDGDSINQQTSAAWYIRNRVSAGSLNLGVETSGGALYYPITMSGASNITIFRNATTEIARFTSNGYLGIGTDSPSDPLTIGDGTNASEAISLKSTNTGNNFINFGDTDSDNSGLIRYDHNSDNMQFNTGGTLRGFFQATGLTVSANSGSTSHFFTYNENGGEIQLYNAAGNIATLIDQVNTATRVLELQNGSTFQIGHGTSNTTGIIEFRSAGFGLAGVIDANANWLFGKSGTAFGTAGVEINQNGVAGKVWITRSGGEPLALNRLTNNGSMLEFYRGASTAVGEISVDGSGFLIKNPRANSYISLFANNQSNGIFFQDGTTKTLAPYSARDDEFDLGGNGNRWDNVYATNGTIQTSDRNDKQDIEELSDAEQRVAVACKGLLRKFRWRSAVEEKGDDARIHFGIIAQDLQDAFTAEGLDAGRYGMFINSTWTDEETGEERSRMGVRYSELLAFIISAI